MHDLLDPPLRALLARLAPGGGRLGAVAGGSRALRLHGGGRTHLRGHRPYTPGDSLSALDWPAYARREALFVREFSPDADRITTIVLDVSASMGARAGPFPEKARALRQLSAALFYLGLWDQGTVRAVSFGGQETAVLKTFHGMGDFDKALSWLAARSGGGNSDPRGALRCAVSGAEPGALLLLSDLHFDPRALQVFEKARRRAARLTVLHTLSPEEIHAPAPGCYLVTDAESGRRMEITITDATGADYTRAFDLWCAHRRRLVERLRGHYHLVNLATPLERLMRDHGGWKATLR